MVRTSNVADVATVTQQDSEVVIPPGCSRVSRDWSGLAGTGHCDGLRSVATERQAVPLTSEFCLRPSIHWSKQKEPDPDVSS